MKSRPGTRWPDPIRDAAIDCGSRVPRCGARAGHSSTLTLPSNSTPTAALPAADAPTAAPETAPGRTVIAAASAPRSAVPSKAASACDSCHVGRRHRRPAQRRERLGIMRYRRHHQPHARCRKQNVFLMVVTFASDCRPARRKACSAATRNRRPPHRFDMRSAGLGIPAGCKIDLLKVSNFAQTAGVRSVSFPADGRVAQSAERVCEQHETVVRNHSPRRQLPQPPQKRLPSGGPG